MKCLLRYQWVKLPRNQLPPGKGIMGAWARLASRAAFRGGQGGYTSACGKGFSPGPGQRAGPGGYFGGFEYGTYEGIPLW